MQNKHSIDQRTGISRRQILQLAPAAAIATAMAGCTDSPPPAGVPLSNFGYRSTAEEVTAGIDLSGKTALVTGCNSGIGFETMRVLALRGAHVYGTGRTMEKAQLACNSVAGMTTPLAIELTDLDSVVSAAARVKADGIPLDIIICNAGIMEAAVVLQLRLRRKEFSSTIYRGSATTTRRWPMVNQNWPTLYSRWNWHAEHATQTSRRIRCDPALFQPISVDICPNGKLLHWIRLAGCLPKPRGKVPPQVVTLQLPPHSATLAVTFSITPTPYRPVAT